MAARDSSPLLTEAPETPWWLAEGRGGPLPGNWPSLQTIEYFSKLIVLILLVLLFPWLVSKALTNPRELKGHPALNMGA